MQLKINLLPPEFVALQQKKLRQRKMLLIGGIVLLVFVVSNVLLMLATFNVKSEITKLQQEKALWDEKAVGFQQYEKMQSQLKHMDGIIKQAAGVTPDWAELIAEIGLVTPPDVWLTDLQANYKLSEEKDTEPTEKDVKGQEIVNPEIIDNVKKIAGTATPEVQTINTGEMVIRGMALDHISVANWLEQLNHVSGLTDIRCQFLSQQDSTDITAIQFEIRAKLQTIKDSAAAGKQPSKAGDE